MLFKPTGYHPEYQWCNVAAKWLICLGMKPLRQILQTFPWTSGNISRSACRGWSREVLFLVSDNLSHSCGRLSRKVASFLCNRFKVLHWFPSIFTGNKNVETGIYQDPLIFLMPPEVNSATASEFKGNLERHLKTSNCFSMSFCLKWDHARGHRTISISDSDSHTRHFYGGIKSTIKWRL